MSSWNQRTGKKVTTKKGASGNTWQRIDVDAIYSKMRDAISRRVEYQRQQDAVWARIERTHCNGTRELDEIDRKIGAETHKINCLISELCQYRKTHRAMNLAYTYICKEIERARRTAESNANTVRRVNAGRSVLISSTGTKHTNTTHLAKYVQQKYAQVARLEKWKQYVARYRV
jgi:hypothetical protein